MPKVALHSESIDPSDFASFVMTTPIADVAEMLVRQANLPDRRAVKWLKPLIDKGPTEEFLRELERTAAHLELQTRVILTRTTEGKPKKFELSQTALYGARDRLLAMATIRILMDQYVNRLHQCQLDDCNTYFVGDPRSKWCSKNCGSKFRVRKKRIRARQ